MSGFRHLYILSLAISKSLSKGTWNKTSAMYEILHATPLSRRCVCYGAGENQTP